MATIILPGIDGSGPAHWQTLWEARDPRMTRFEPASWDKPDLPDWIAALDRAILAAPEPPLLVAHSLACLLVAHWAARERDAGERVRGAFLVAVPDPDGPAFPATDAASFRTVPEARLPFPALVVVSTDDPCGTLDHARRRAVAWGAGLVAAGTFGHINGLSGLGDWPQGAMLLDAFRAGTARRGPARAGRPEDRRRPHGGTPCPFMPLTSTGRCSTSNRRPCATPTRSARGPHAWRSCGAPSSSSTLGS